MNHEEGEARIGCVGRLNGGSSAHDTIHVFAMASVHVTSKMLCEPCSVVSISCMLAAVQTPVDTCPVERVECCQI